jgi:hypothetical protein
MFLVTTAMTAMPFTFTLKVHRDFCIFSRGGPAVKAHAENPGDRVRPEFLAHGIEWTGHAEPFDDAQGRLRRSI